VTSVSDDIPHARIPHQHPQHQSGPSRPTEQGGIAELPCPDVWVGLGVVDAEEGGVDRYVRGVAKDPFLVG
jgi:hypothetical protein